MANQAALDEVARKAGEFSRACQAATAGLVAQLDEVARKLEFPNFHLGARLRDEGELVEMIDALPLDTVRLSEYCNLRHLFGLERDIWRELLSYGEILQPVYGMRYAHKAGALFRTYLAATDGLDALLDDDAPLDALDDDDAFDVLVQVYDAQRLLAAVGRMVAAYVRECLRAQAVANAGLSDDVLQAVRAKAGEPAANVARDHATIRKRRRPAYCSMSTRRAALVGYAAAVAPPVEARNHHQSIEVRNE